MECENSLVSVIVPAYNHENYIQQCLDSIIAQNYDNIELIVLNDGSKDNTYSKILEYKDKCLTRFKNFQIINKENEGVSKTLNKGIELSKGKFICFIASDDMMIEGRIKKQVEYMNLNNSSISCGNSLILNENTKSSKSIINEKLKLQYKGNQFYNLIINYFISSPTVMINKSVIEKIGKFDENSKIEDWPYYVKASRDFKIDFINENLCYYRIHGNNTQTNKKNMFIIEKQVLNKFFEMYDLPTNIKKKAMSELYIRNKERNKNQIGKIKDIFISQIYYFDTKRIRDYLKKRI